MIPMVGYEVCYSLDAFTLSSEEDARRQLEAALKTAQADVFRWSRGLRIVHRKDLLIGGESPRMELMVVVPAGSDQRVELIAAITYFEAAMSRELGARVNNTCRTVESEEARATPKCSACDANAYWVRKTQFGDETYFCDLHAHQESDFDEFESLGWPLWERLHPIKIS